VYWLRCYFGVRRVCYPLFTRFTDNVEMEIVLPGTMTVMESHDIALALQHKLEGLEEVERAFVHVSVLLVVHVGRGGVVCLVGAVVVCLPLRWPLVLSFWSSKHTRAFATAYFRASSHLTSAALQHCFLRMY
jgi:hypothetical protein